jgi:DNA-binding transcriptional regulator YiaG
MTATELAEIRERMGWTQQEFGQRLGTTQGRYNDWERGRRPVPMQVAAHVRTIVETMGRRGKR